MRVRKPIANLVRLTRSKRIFHEPIIPDRARGSSEHSCGSPTRGFAWRSFTWSRRWSVRPQIVRRSQFGGCRVKSAIEQVGKAASSAFPFFGEERL